MAKVKTIENKNFDHRVRMKISSGIQYHQNKTKQKILYKMRKFLFKFDREQICLLLPNDRVDPFALQGIPRSWATEVRAKNIKVGSAIDSGLPVEHQPHK